MGDHDEQTCGDGQDGRGGPGDRAPEIEAVVTLEIRVTDWPALRAAGHRAVSGLRFEGADPERQRAAMAAEVDEGPQGALNVLLDPEQLLEGIPGVELLGGALTTRPADAFEPDFAELFPLDLPPAAAPGEGWLLTPRTACLLYEQLSALADAGYDDVEEYGGAPVAPGEEHEWAVLGRLPRLTWKQDAAWRRRMARAFDDLAGDLADGRWPQPRCPAEEMALHLALADAAAALEDEPDHIAELMDGLPAHPFDYDWTACRAFFPRDHDILLLGEPGADGIEDPDSEANRELGLGDLRPPAWFTAFADAEPRDPDRGFRR
ncbi:hypothetical protein [Peterkaempfera bronchialis]|uniref:Uncharacterized protein n=1 Tax=Peterkaempfera bronchialis TaxID=2126346 RepID=A0A345SXD1_9ACTN|nr:hypothetical protein [Peterkaempfera bronchialis]AXI78386.1 hypothetical protein C7M71_014015 [Peterkaempfera bronchialis]